MKSPHVTHRFDSPVVLKFTESVIESWYPNEQPILFVPCAKSKPIQNSRSHKQLFHRFQDCCEMLIISEPMTVIPYSFFDYPAYEYPPSALWRIEGEAEKFKRRLARFLQRKRLNERCCRFLLPQHHLLILWAAWERAFGNVKNLDGYGYTYATRWFFAKKLMQELCD
ncbi:MAG: hypothetical protein GF309_07530 [Candidatus Lokiarchaeota archaeon]|nr:hypothetical protein [Candidatus Lokiarchaeota archaeon]